MKTFEFMSTPAFESMSALAIAIVANALEAGIELLKSGADPNAIASTNSSYQPSSLLYWAAALNRLDMARLLIDHDASVHRGLMHFEAPLAAAVRGNHPEMTRLLITSGARVDAGDHYNYPLLTVAADRNYPQIARLLLGNGADVNQSYGISETTPLRVASRRNHIEMVKMLVYYGAEFDAPDMLVRVLRGEGFEVAEFFLGRVDINAKVGLWDDTPLHVMAAGNFIESARFLIDHGADVNSSPGSFGHTPLMVAVSNEKLEMARLLIGNGANVNMTDISGHTPLHHAAFRGNRTIAQLLIDSGAHVAAEDNEGRTTGGHGPGGRAFQPRPRNPDEADLRGDLGPGGSEPQRVGGLWSRIQAGLGSCRATRWTTERRARREVRCDPGSRYRSRAGLRQPRAGLAHRPGTDTPPGPEPRAGCGPRAWCVCACPDAG